MVYATQLYGCSVTGYSGGGEFCLDDSQLQVDLQLIHQVNDVVIVL